MKKIVPFLVLVTILSCNTGETEKASKYLSQSTTASHDSIEAIIKRQNDLRDKIQEIKEQNRETYSIGSAESEVIRIQGQPTSVLGEAPNQLFFYGHDYVKFKDGRVSNYSNTDGTLRIELKPNATTGNKTTVEVATPKGKTKYVYFTCYIKEFNEQVKYYSKIFKIENYTTDKMFQIGDCLTERVRFFTRTTQKITMLPSEFETYSLVSSSWSNQSGNIMPGQDFCK